MYQMSQDSSVVYNKVARSAMRVPTGFTIICLHEIIAKLWYSSVCESRATDTQFTWSKATRGHTLQGPHLKTHPTHAKHAFIKWWQHGPDEMCSISYLE